MSSAPSPFLPCRRFPLVSYALATAVMGAGALLAAREYPGGYDWPYTVMSALASSKHNPGGGAWFAGGLILAMALLWPGARFLRTRSTDTGWSHGALRVGLVAGALVGAERLFVFHLSTLLPKAHEVLALVCFVALYAALLGLTLQRAQRRRHHRWAAVVVVIPLVAIGVSQAVIYLGQRDLGWVDRHWRELGVPMTMSLAFWQWLAAAALWVGLGHLLVTAEVPDPHARERPAAAGTADV